MSELVRPAYDRYGRLRPATIRWVPTCDAKPRAMLADDVPVMNNVLYHQCRIPDPVPPKSWRNAWDTLVSWWTGEEPPYV